MAVASHKYLTFALAGEEYAVPVLKVREIVTMMETTSVPQMPPYMRGVVNLRGRVIPIVDLRAKLGLAPADYSDRTCIVIAEVNAGDGGSAAVGLTVDAVCDVLTIAPSDMTASSDLYGSRDDQYVESLARIKGRVKILLNVDRLAWSDSFTRVVE